MTLRKHNDRVQNQDHGLAERAPDFELRGDVSSNENPTLPRCYFNRRSRKFSRLFELQLKLFWR